MRCAQCGFDSPDGMTFCGSCGARLTRACTSCGSDNPPDFRFCGRCGTPLPGDDAHLPPASAPGPTASALEGTAERRQLTVMFCDLVGSTSLSAQLDPEELREVIRSYQTACAEVIERYEGYVAQYLGDGVLAYFGYPVATEQEAGRAIRAGLEIIQSIQALSDGLEIEYTVSLSARIGIHTGLVVVGEIGAGQRREHLALGETPNLAARIQAAAAPDTVVVSGETYRLAERDFEVEALGVRTIRGIPSPVALYQVVGERTRRRAMAGTPGTEAEVVGRERELEVLHDRLQRLPAEGGQVVLLSGDAGIGKTSLVRAFVQQLDPSSLTLQEGRCLPYYRTTPYHPILDLLCNRAGCSLTDHPADRLRSLTDQAEKAGLTAAESAPLLASLLGPPGQVEGGGSKPRQAKEGILSALLRLLVSGAREKLLILHLEDLHWADPSTLELIGRLVREVTSHRVLLLLTARPEFHAPWEQAPHLLHLPITRLLRTEVGRIIERITGGKQLPAAVSEQIVRRTDGVPLFVEELTKMVLESGLLHEAEDRYELPGTLPALSIPATLHDSLEARLERLASTKNVAQLGAILGREFSYDLLQAVCALSEPVLLEALDQLVEAELLVRHGASPHTTYAFKHALIQEAAYQSLLKGVRQAYHLRVAQTLEERFPARAAAEPEVLAQHYAAAGLTEAAIREWTRAGRRAVERSASREAVAHLREGLALLEGAPQDAERDALELSLLLSLGPALIATEGHASPGVRDVYARAVELSRGSAAPAHHFPVLGGLFTSYFVRSEMVEAHRVAKEMLVLAETTDDPARQMSAQIVMGISYLEQGVPAAATDYLEEGLQIYRPEQHFRLAHSAGQDFGVVGLGHLAYARFVLGYPDRSAAHATEAVELARRLDHPHSLAFALAFSAFVAFMRQEPEGVLRWGDELVRLAVQEGFPHWLVRAPLLQGWALIDMGREEEGLQRVVEGLHEPQAGMEFIHCSWLAGACYLHAGLPEEAVSHLGRARTLLEKLSLQPWWASELSRLSGVALASLGHQDRGEALLQESARLASSVGARPFLLRSLADLTRLARTPADRSAAAASLRELHGSFTEGLELRDLRGAAKALEAVEAAAIHQLPSPRPA